MPDLSVTPLLVRPMGSSLTGTQLATLITGAVNIAAYAGVTVGVLASSTARVANGLAIQAALDYCADNGLIAYFPAGRYEYSASRTENGYNVGLQVKKGCPGVTGAGCFRGTGGTRLVQYASNQPILTLGHVTASISDIVGSAVYSGLRLFYGATQAGQTQAAGLLLGFHCYGSMDEITVCWDDGFHAYIGLRGGETNVQFIFSMVFGRINVETGQLSIVYWIANGTGNVWGSLYCGGGSVGNRITLSGPAIDLNGLYNLEFGSIAQLNIEWVTTYYFLSNTSNGLGIDILHLEGCKLTGDNGSMLFSNSGTLRIGKLSLLNVWITSAAATGAPSILRAYSDSKIDVSDITGQWDGGAEKVCDMAWQLFFDDTSLLGRKPRCHVGSLFLQGGGLTGAFSPDGTITGAAPGAAGAITSFNDYKFNKDRSELEGTALTMGNAAMTVYGAHYRAKVTMATALTANRTLTLSDKLASAGAGSASVRNAGDILEVVRTGAGAFDLVVANQSAVTLYTFTGSASANTAKSFEWSGSAWTAL